MRILTDTNVLTRIAQAAHHQHASASTAVERLLARDERPNLESLVGDLRTPTIVLTAVAI